MFDLDLVSNGCVLLTVKACVVDRLLNWIIAAVGGKHACYRWVILQSIIDFCPD